MNAPLNPAVFHAARAWATVMPTRSGTISQVGVGVGAGVPVGDGVGVGPSLGAGVTGGDVNGEGVGTGIAVVIAEGVEVGAATGAGPPAAGGAVGTIRGSLVRLAGPRVGGASLRPARGVARPAGVGCSVTRFVPPATECDGGRCAARTGPLPLGAAGVPTALSTPPVGASEVANASVTPRRATATNPAATGARRLRGCVAARRGSRAGGPASGDATGAPQPGHPPAAPFQQRSQANTQQEAHIRNPASMSFDAAPTWFPQRSQ